MLKSIIVYPPGAGGTLLQRVMTLDERTIWGSGGRSADETMERVGSDQRLQVSCTWGHSPDTWKEQEWLTRYGYISGPLPWERYVLSPLWFIDRAHPSGLLEPAGQERYQSHPPESVIMIEPSEQDRDLLEANQGTKGYTLHWDWEIECMARVRAQWAAIPTRTIPFHHLMHGGMFLSTMHGVGELTGLHMPPEYVRIIWASWQQANRALGW
jgi:hypothetical protein